MDDVTESDLLAAIRAAYAAKEDDDDEYMTSIEIARAINEPRKKVHELLRELHHGGQLEVGRVRRVNIAGYHQTVPGYKLVNHDDNG